MAEPQTLGDIIDQLPAPIDRKVPVAITPMQMLQTAVERGADIAMLEKLLTLQERWEANEAKKAFVVALAAFKADPPTVIKNKHAGFESKRTGDKTDYEYATLDQVCGVIAPALSRHGLSHRWETAQHDGRVRVTCILTHELGHSESVALEAGADTTGSKNAIQAIGSAVSYLQRYTLLAITGLAASGQDDDGQRSDQKLDNLNGGAISAEQKDELIALMKETGADTIKFLAYFKVASIDEIPGRRFSNAKALLERKKERR